MESASGARKMDLSIAEAGEDLTPEFTYNELLNELLAIIDDEDRPEGEGWYTAAELDVVNPQPIVIELTPAQAAPVMASAHLTVKVIPITLFDKTMIDHLNSFLRACTVVFSAVVQDCVAW